MIVSVDGEQIYELPLWKELVLKDNINSDIFDEDMIRRLKWVIEHKFERCYERFEKEWLPKLRADETVQSIPKSQEEFVELVTSRQDYKDKKQRDLDAQE